MSVRAWDRPGRALAAAGGALAVAVLALPYVPYQDVLGHAGLLALRQRWAGAPEIAGLYEVDVRLGPYSLFRGLSGLLAGLLGAERAVRLVLVLAVASAPAAVAVARRALGRRTPAAIAASALAFSLGFMTVQGFASYELALAWVLPVFAWAVRVQRAERTGALELAGLAASAAALFFAHGHAWVVCALLVAALVARRPRAAGSWRLVASAGPSAAVVAAVAVRDRVVAIPAGALGLAPPEPLLAFQAPLDKLSLLLTPTLTTRLGVDVILGLALAAGLVAAWRRVPAEAPGRAEVAAAWSAVAAAFVALPHFVGWFGFVDGRLVPLLALLPLLVVEVDDARVAGGRGLSLGPRWPVGAVLALLALHGGALVGFQSEARGFESVSAVVPAGARVLHLPVDGDSRLFTGHPFVHADKRLLLARPVVLSDLWFHQGTGVYPTRCNPVVRVPGAYREAHLGPLDWASLDRRDWDFVLVRLQPGAPAIAVPDDLRLAAQEGGYWLYASTVAEPWATRPCSVEAALR
jgi:hypothetical protein